VGSNSVAARTNVARLFEAIDSPLVLTDNLTAETIKYVSNAFLATKSSFVNQVAQLCDVVGANIDVVLEGMSLDDRIGSGHMRPGPGWGGPCLSKDSKSLLHVSEKSGFDFTVVRAAVEANDLQFDLIVEKVREAIGGNLDGTIIAVWGLTFKAGTDDIRNSPSLEIIRKLVAQGSKIHAYDPSIRFDRVDLPDYVNIHSDLYSVCRGAHALVVLTEWDEFRIANFGKVYSEIGSPVIVDGRNILDSKIVRGLNFSYVGLGNHI
jgi:UDPglucose 6-dehydrogenase